MVIFVGSKEKGAHIEEALVKYDKKVIYIEENTHIKEQVNDILMNSKNAEHIIYDLEQYVDDKEVIVDHIVKIEKSNRAKPIILFPTTSSKNSMILACIEQGIKLFVDSSLTWTDIKDEIVKAISGMYDNGEIPVPAIEKIQEAIKEEQEKSKNTVKIGVAGAIERIGTTTQCIQISKYLSLKGYSSCVIFMNTGQYKSNFVDSKNNLVSYPELCAIAFTCDIVDRNKAYVRYENVDMYYDYERFIELNEKNYDFLIFDYGNIKSYEFNKQAFLKDDFNIIVCGSSPAEFNNSVELINDSSYRKCSLIFSFISKNDEQDVREVFEGALDGNSSIAFADYTPDPFVFTSKEAYDKLLKLKDKDGFETKENKKRFLFKRKRK